MVFVCIFECLFLVLFFIFQTVGWWGLLKPCFVAIVLVFLGFQNLLIKSRFEFFLSSSCGYTICLLKQGPGPLPKLGKLTCPGFV